MENLSSGRDRKAASKKLGSLWESGLSGELFKEKTLTKSGLQTKNQVLDTITFIQKLDFKKSTVSCTFLNDLALLRN